MGSNNNIEFSSGTISIDGCEPIPVKDFKIQEVSLVPDADVPFDRVIKFPSSVEFTGTIEGFKLTFGARVRLFGFWRTVRTEIRRIFGRKKY
jgi:hypothetical protein